METAYTGIYLYSLLLFCMIITSMFRALADQLMLTDTTGSRTHDFKELRKIAAKHIQDNAEEYSPFLGLLPEEVFDYCQKVSSDTLAEWGGQVELKALSESLKRQIHVYAASSPTVKMGESNGQEPLRLAFHRHFYALGEHYNSIIPIQQHCGCDC
jgi:OTU domain-containing protein 6